MSRADTTDAEPRAVSARIVLLSASGVWLFYFALVTARSFLTDANSAASFVAPRALVSLAGITVTLLLWLALRRLERRSSPRLKRQPKS